MKKEGWGYAFGTAGKFIGIGWFFAILIIVGIGGGVWLDNKAGTSPLFMILGLVIAVSAIVLSIYKIYLEARRR